MAEQKLVENGPLKYQLHGKPMFGQVDVILGDNEEVLADAGTLLWADGSVSVSTNCYGGCMDGCKRNLAKESCCLNKYEGPGRVGFGFPLMGDILPFAVTPNFSWLLSQGAFICGTSNCKISGRLRCCAGCFASEGYFLTYVGVNDDKPGLFFAGGFGSLRRHDIPPNKTLLIDNGMFFAASSETKINYTWIGRNSSCMTTCCSQEGVVMSITGPCTVFTQSRNPDILKPTPVEAPAGQKDQQ